MFWKSWSVLKRVQFQKFEMWVWKGLKKNKQKPKPFTPPFWPKTPQPTSFAPSLFRRPTSSSGPRSQRGPTPPPLSLSRTRWQAGPACQDRPHLQPTPFLSPAFNRSAPPAVSPRPPPLPSFKPRINTQLSLGFTPPSFTLFRFP
jgi:hypothetical protein